MTGQSDNLPEVTGGPILPRFMRRPARQLRRLLNGGFHVSRRWLVVCGVAFALLAGGAGIFAKNGSDVVMASLAPSLGLAIRAFDISGNHEVSEFEIAGIVASARSTSILGFNVKKARKALKKHPWIADAQVSRVYPDTLKIDIIERDAFALWQTDSGLNLIDRDGLVLGSYDGRENTLPLLVGAGAETGAAEFIATMNRFPSIASAATAYVRIGERRWDIKLKNGITILLPEENADRELARLLKLDSEKELLARDVRRIDMRIENRMIVQVPQSARQLIEEKRDQQLKLLATSRKERNT